jgi:hypothetical protein
MPETSHGKNRRAVDGSPIERAVALVRRAVPTQSQADTAGWLVARFILGAVGVRLAWIVTAGADRKSPSSRARTAASSGRRPG